MISFCNSVAFAHVLLQLFFHIMVSLFCVCQQFPLNFLFNPEVQAKLTNCFLYVSPNLSLIHRRLKDREKKKGKIMQSLLEVFKPQRERRKRGESQEFQGALNPQGEEQRVTGTWPQPSNKPASSTTSFASFQLKEMSPIHRLFKP